MQYTGRMQTHVQTPPPPAAADPIRASKFRRLLQRVDAFRGTGQTDAAIGALQQALELEPEHVPTLLQLAELHYGAGRHNETRAATLRALTGHLESPQVALLLVRMLNLMSESGLIMEVARQLPPNLWDSPTSLAEMAQELSMVGAHEMARQYVVEALRRDPRHPPSLVMRATLDVFHGDLASAAEHAERCLQLLPTDSGSHWLLSRLKLPDAERRVARIEALLATDPPLEDQSRLAYAIHNELHEIREYDRAWAALERGCKAKRATLDYTQAGADTLFQELLGWTRDEVATGDGCDEERLVPVFVIGLHRSGTTLAERVLTGHSRIAAGGETYDIRAALRRASNLHFNGELDLRVVRARHGFDYRAMGQGYLRGMAWRARGLSMVTDKLPSNYLNVGFIARALPRARFIHLNRDPIDVGLSSLRTLFSHACPYSYSQQEYVAHWRNYRRLMDHWRALLPGRILDVDYQSLVDRPEEIATEMARFCGLEFEPAMVQIKERTDAVSTASSVMMRDGIRRDRGRVWARYERQLQPMIEALSGEG